MNENVITSRYAPTPSGLLHFGNLFNFFLIYKMIQKVGGKIILRIDDADHNRSRDEFIEDIFETLDWLSLSFDIGPKNLTDHKNNWSQQNKKDRYFSLVKMGLTDGTLFVCDCSRKSNDCICKNKNLVFAPGRNLIRANIPESPIIWRRDDIPAYHLTTIVDDEDFDINLVVRGEDLLESTEIQKKLCPLFGLKKFLNATIIHHPLIMDENGKKLSKSFGANSIREMKKAGTSADQILARLDDAHNSWHNLKTKRS